jgi:hypothetical protein
MWVLLEERMNYEELSSAEMAAFEGYKAKYLAFHPVLEKPKPEGVGWRLFLIVLVSAASIILASLRTAQQFYKAASLGGSDLLGYAEAVAVIFAVEGGLVVYSTIRAINDKEKKKRLLKWGIWIMLLISIIAGLGQSINLINEINRSILNVFEYVLSFVIGVFSSVLAWISGEVLGGEIARLILASETIEGEYQQYLEEYQSSMLQSWSSSTERKMARSAFISSESSFGSPGSFSTKTNRLNPPIRQPVKEQEIFEFITGIFNVEGRIPGPKEIADTISCAKGYASDVRKKWIEQNSEAI